MIADSCPSLKELKSWFEKNRERIKEDLFSFLRFASISTDPAYKKDLEGCAKWLAAYAKEKGLHAELLPTSTVPIVYIEGKSEKKGAKTLLAYGHYDVQPVDPIALWESDPFEPVEKGGKIFARGACDDKGQIFYALTAALAWVDLGKPFPIGLKFCIEGEEECHSKGLTESLPHLREKLKTDALLIVDFDQLEGEPSLTLGARGVAALEVVLTGSNTDLHSGILGGIAYNPNRALAELLSQLYDGEGKIQIPGFYDEVDREDHQLYAYPYDATYFQDAFNIRAFGGQRGKSLQEANWFQPTLDINGMFGGYTGSGVKTVIPARATAKLSMRLVPSQKPEKILRALEKFLKERAPKGMEVDVILQGGEAAWRGSPNSDLALAVSKAASEATGKKCKNILSGASIPVVTHLKEALGSSVAGMGYALASDKIHAPNEHFDMERFEMGFLTFGRTIAMLGQMA